MVSTNMAANDVRETFLMGQAVSKQTPSAGQHRDIVLYDGRTGKVIQLSSIYVRV